MAPARSSSGTTRCQAQDPCRALSAVVFSVLSAGILLGPMNNSSAWYGVLLLAAVLGFVWTFVTSIALASSSDAALTTTA